MVSGFRHYFLLTLSWFTLTTLLVVLLLQTALKEAEIRFHVDTDWIHKTLEEKTRVNEAVLEGMAAFFGVAPIWEDQSARNYARAMHRRYPHIYMLEAQTRVVFSEREELERRMRSKGFAGFQIRTFSYGGDRTWQPAPSEPDYYPIIFMEPITEESRQVLGLDIGSVPHLREALNNSVASDGPAASAPFRLVEGDIAYVLFRPAIQPPDHGKGTAGALTVVSLVVRAADLLSAKHLNKPTISCALYFLDATGGGKTLISQVSQKPIQSEFERLVLPVFTAQYSLRSKSQPFVLTVERQAGWDILNTPLLASTIVLSTAGFILLLFNTRKRLTTERERTEAYRLLENERAQLDQTIQERTSELSALAEKLFEVQEQERRTLARELHDEIGQTLTAIKTEAVLIKEKCGGRSPEISESADAIQTQSDSVYDITHNIMRRLRPRALDDLGLIPSLDNCIAAARLEEHGAKLHVWYDGELDRLGEPANITLYRILQEALTNIGKHAGAKNVWIEVKRLTAPIPKGSSDAGLAGAVQLVVRDDGRGMNPAHTITGLGLVGVRERVQALRGSFQLQTAPGEGLALSVTIPVEEAADDHE